MKTSNLPKRHKPIAIPKDVYGCEVIDDFLPKEFAKLRKRYGFRKILAVPHRNENLMTGSGLPNQCHGNVRHMVEHIGGEQLLGFWIQDVSRVFTAPPKTAFAFYWHSVWITPEKNLVDLTEENNDVPKKFRRPRRTFSAFIPITKFKDGYWTQGIQTFAATKNYKKEGITLIHRNEAKIQKIPYLAPSKRKGISITKRDSVEYLYECGVFGGGFSQPSSATGKHFDEIRKAA